MTIPLGSRGEALVAHDLKRKGYAILACNYKRPCGEIDIIAKDRSTLVFVEVKTRQTHYFDAAELITPKKQKRIIATANSYLLEQKHATIACRFDVALISWHETAPVITYLHDAFDGDV